MTTPGEDILAWTTAAITRRQEAARAVGWDTIEAADHLWDTKYLILRRGDESLVTTELASELAVHIAANDPESVLLRCAADRKLLELHRPDGGDCVVCADQETPSEDSEGQVEWARSAVMFPCPTVRALAEGYGWTEGER